MTTTLRRAPAAASARVHPAAWPLAAGALGLLVSLVGIGVPSIWYDEVATITASTRSWPQLFEMLGTVDAVHALYYSLMHIWFDLVGYTPLTLRIPSAIAVGLAAGLVVVLGRQLGRPRLAIIAGLVFCLLPRVTWMGTEGRSYALGALAAVLLTVVFLEAQAAMTARWWVLYGLLSLLSCLLFLYLALIVLAHAVTVLVRVLRRDPGRPRLLVSWGLAAGAAALLLLPFVQVVTAQSGQVSWIDPLSQNTIRQVFRTQWFHYSYPFAIAAWALILVGAIARGRRGRELAVLLPLLVVPTLALLLTSAVDSPVYQPRYLTFCTPFAALAVAAGIDALRARSAMVGAVLVLAVLAVPQVIDQRQPEAKDVSTWAAVADLIGRERAEAPAGTATGIIYGTVQRHPSATSRVIAYAYPDPFEGTADITLRIPAAESGRLWEYAAPIARSTEALHGLDTVFLITSNARDLRPETTRVMAGAGWHVTESWRLQAVHILEYERD